MQNNNLIVKNSFIVNALRNCGYDPYTAISDIIDNSIEPEVESSFVKVDFEIKDKRLDAILIIDNGNGMDMEKLKEAMCLGSETGKNGDSNLGMYGSGLDTSSFSLGQKLEVFSKMVDSELNYAVIDLGDAIRNKGDIKVEYEECSLSSDEYASFNEKVGGVHGTIVRISELDKFPNKDINNFKDTLRNRIGENFNKFVQAGDIKFYIGNKRVPYIELMGNKLSNEILGEGSFDVDGHVIRYRAFYIPNIGSSKDDSTLTMPDGTEYIKNTLKNQGLYIYRQNRLVGRAVTLGLYSKDSWVNGFRCEIFIDGNCDSMFGSTFNKIIKADSNDGISQSLFDKLTKEILPFKNEVARRSHKRANDNKTLDPEEQKKTEDFYKRVTETQNNNVMLKGKRRGENKPSDKENVEHTPRGPQKNPNPTKQRTNKWFDGFEEVSMGGENMYVISRTNKKIIIQINTDHKFYTEFYSQLCDELKFKMAQIISCDEIAKQQVNYYGSCEVQQIIDEYNEINSNEVRKSFLP